MTAQAVHFIISGRVQGVGYRAWMCGIARKIGVEGWVRNLSDGTVEAVAAGTPAQLTQLEAACHDGPVAAKVEQVTVSPANEPIVPGSGFQQRKTV